MEEMRYDLNFREPRVILTEGHCIIENAEAIVMIGENSITVLANKKYVILKGSDFVIKEICEGRLLIEGNILGVEFLHSQSKHKDRGI
jgi:sporulation protein YqfC